MIGSQMLHWPTDASTSARGTGYRFGAGKKWRLSAVPAVYFDRARHQRWMTEEAAKASRRHSLLEDNPTAG